MFLIDTNVWIAQTFSAHPGHEAAWKALSQATSENPALFCRATQQSFLRVASTSAVLKQYGSTGMSNEDVLLIFDRFMALPVVAFREEPADIVPLWHRFARRQTASPKLWMDAYLAAFAITAQLSIITFDGDFKQFEHAGLKLQLLKAP